MTTDRQTLRELRKAQLTEADVKRLFAERKFDEIEAARAEGRLDLVLGVPPAQVAALERGRNGTPTAEDITTLSRMGRHDLIDEARRDGRLDHLLTEGA